jgi:hypothetical protein
MQCAAGHTFSGKVVEELLSDAVPRISNLAVLLSQGKGAIESTTMTNTTTRGVLLLAQSEKWHRMEVRTTRDLVQPMISIRQGVKSAHDRVPKRRGRDCPHWPSFCDAIGIRGQILHSLYQFRTLVHKSRTIFINVVTKVAHPIECIKLMDPSRANGFCLRPPAETRHTSSLPLFLLDMVPAETLQDHFSPFRTH